MSSPRRSTAVHLTRQGVGTCILYDNCLGKVFLLETQCHKTDSAIQERAQVWISIVRDSAMEPREGDIANISAIWQKYHKIF